MCITVSIGEVVVYFISAHVRHHGVFELGNWDWSVSVVEGWSQGEFDRRSTSSGPKVGPRVILSWVQSGGKLTLLWHGSGGPDIYGEWTQIPDDCLPRG
jgi:hypothetical protein